MMPMPMSQVHGEIQMIRCCICIHSYVSRSCNNYSERLKDGLAKDAHDNVSMSGNYFY